MLFTQSFQLVIYSLLPSVQIKSSATLNFLTHFYDKSREWFSSFLEGRNESLSTLEGNCPNVTDPI